MRSDAWMVGRRIKRLRKLKGWSQEVLCAKLGVNENTATRWERGIYLPALRLRGKLAKLLETDVDNLFADIADLIEEGHDKTVETSLKLLDKNDLTGPDLSAASNVLTRLDARTRKSRSSFEQEMRNSMKGAHERLLGKLARLRLDKV